MLAQELHVNVPDLESFRFLTVGCTLGVWLVNSGK